MAFNRPPRIQKPLPSEKIKIPSPPSIPSKPESGNWLMAILPLLAMVITLVLVFSFMSEGGSSTSYLIFMPIMVISYIGTFITTWIQKKNYDKKVEEARKSYRAELRQVENQLIELNQQEKQQRLKNDPDFSECVRRAQTQDPRLGERRVADKDFLHLRIGTGRLPVSYSLDVPEKMREKHEFEQEEKFISEISGKYQILGEVPIQARLRDVGSIGIAGIPGESRSITRAMICQAVVHHWCTEVNIAVICPESYLAEWSWVKELPHAHPLIQVLFNHPRGKTANMPSERLLESLEAEIHRREQTVEAGKLVSSGKDQQAVLPLPRLLLVIDGLDPDFNHPALELILEKGKELGIYAFFLTESSIQIPGECGAVIRASGTRLVYEEAGEAGISYDVDADLASIKPAEILAKSLGGIDWEDESDASRPPETIGFLQMMGAKTIEDLKVEKWWAGSPPFGFLRAPIGRISATSDLIFDLNDRDGAHGPHGLVGGMTGSGKSEVLKAIILALAVTHHPYEINFALIDFKGGAAFNELSRLPHTVGVVTDIESNATYAERVIQALSGEIERRKRILEETRAAFNFGRSHVDEYRKLRVKQPLPRLVIVFDEFAEFKQRNPEESKRLISIARQGRSLGVHLILATQNIEAAIDPEILQNSSFRICLKVSQPQDSIQMIGIPDAINLTRGRAYFHSNTRVLYQSAFSGATYEPYLNKQGGEKNFIKILPDGRRVSVDISAESSKVASELVLPSTETAAVVDHLNEIARRMHISKHPPAVWPDPLPERLYLPDLIANNFSGGWTGSAWSDCSEWTGQKQSPFHLFPILGLYDVPAKQQQFLLRNDPARGGHLMVFGSAGSGKSTLLRSLVISLALTHTPSKVHVYVLDFGGQPALKQLDGLPHVGSVVTRLETERAERLVEYIKNEINRRNALLRSARVDNWLDFNEKQSSDDEKLPAIYLIIDNFREFRNSFEPEFIQDVCALVGGGQAAGLFMTVASALMDDVPADLYANINMRVTFNQADPTSYYNIVGQPSEARLQEDAAKGMRPGRGLMRGTPPQDFQAVLPVRGESDSLQAENLANLVSEMNAAWNGSRPQSIKMLPYHIELSAETKLDLGARAPLAVMLGREFERLNPDGFSLAADGPAFLVASNSSQSGKTTVLRTWLLGLLQNYSVEKLHINLVDFHSRSLAPFRKFPQVCNYIGTRSNLDDVLAEILSEIEKRQTQVDKAYKKDPDKFDQLTLTSTWPHLLTVIDDYDRFSLQASESAPLLAECITRGGDLGVSFIISGTIPELPGDYDDAFMKRFRMAGCGILLGGTEGIEDFNNPRRPMGQPTSGLPQGRGFIIRRGRAVLLQIAAPWAMDENPADGLQKRVEALLKKK